jgi:carbon monoxide dehydrogenase subunit G
MKSIFYVAGLATMMASPALALDVSRSAQIAAPPAKVWATIGQFCGIGDWHPVVEKCVASKVGGKNVRTLSLKGGGTLVEQEQSRSDAKRTYTYTILSGPLPVAGYRSTLTVAPSGTGSKVTWVGHFKAAGAPDAKATEVIAGIYEAGFTGLAAKTK